MILTYMTCIYSLKFNVLSYPSNRCAHKEATPLGGGISIVVTLMSMFVYAGLSELMSWQEILAIALPGCLVATIGFLDDHRSLQIRYRLFAHFCAANLAVFLLPSFPVIQFGSITLTSPVLLHMLIVIGLVWLLNLYNFMDGIDGIASCEAISILFSAAIIIYFSNETYWSQILMWICAPIGGFLLWNWPPAKIFMGDVGSGFLGVSIGIIALLTSADSVLTIWSWIILLGVFVSDATWTLLIRIVTGQKWHQPHNTHTYQILARKTKSHLKVSIGVVVINTVWLAPLAWISVLNPSYGWVLALIAYLPLLLICWFYSAGKQAGKTNFKLV